MDFRARRSERREWHFAASRAGFWMGSEVGFGGWCAGEFSCLLEMAQETSCSAWLRSSFGGVEGRGSLSFGSMVKK